MITPPVMIAFTQELAKSASWKEKAVKSLAKPAIKGISRKDVLLVGTGAAGVLGAKRVAEDVTMSEKIRSANRKARRGGY